MYVPSLVRIMINISLNDSTVQLKIVINSIKISYLPNDANRNVDC